MNGVAKWSSSEIGLSIQLNEAIEEEIFLASEVAQAVKNGMLRKIASHKFRLTPEKEVDDVVDSFVVVYREGIIQDLKKINVYRTTYYFPGENWYYAPLDVDKPLIRQETDYEAFVRVVGLEMEKPTT